MPDNPERRRSAEVDIEVEGLKDHIGSIATMSAAVGERPDLSSIWASDEFRALPEDARRRLTEWARQEGYDAPIEGGDDASRAAEALKSQAEAIMTMSAAMGAEADLSPVFESPEFRSLPKTVRDSLLSELGGADAATGVDEVEQAAPAPEREVAAPERRKERRPMKRRFSRYRVETDAASGAMTVVEDYEEWNADKEEYEPKTTVTTIELPKALAEEPGAAKTFADAATGIRKELDARGVKLFFDRPKDDPSRIRPKWKYFLEGKPIEDLLDTEDIPEDVMRIVREDETYYRRPEWHRWFGPEMQRKRESVIASVIRERLTEEEPPARETAAAPAPTERGAETAKEVDVSEGLKVLAENFAPLYDMPKDANVLVRHVTQFAGSLFRYRRERAGKDPAGTPDADERAMVRRALVEHFRSAGRPDAADAVEKAFSGERAAEAATDDTSSRIRGARDKEGLERIMAELEEQREHGDQRSREEAARHLMDIEFGRAGKASEERLDGLERSERERAFFAEHPSLERRNVEVLDDGRVVVHVDRRDPEAALRRALEAALADTGILDGRDADENAAREAIVYIERLLSGARDPHEAAVRAFRDKVAVFDADTAELSVHSIERLETTLRNAYSHTLELLGRRGR